MEYRHETLAVHAGQVPDPATLARAVPVYRTTAYNFKSAKHGADLFALKESGNIYARLMNPTNDVLEKRLAALDKGAAALTINGRTRAIYIETVGNPALDVADIEEYSRIAKRHHLPLIADSTFTPPTLLRPIEHGADIVIHSLSKWIGGHGTAIGGAVVDAGKFDWSDPKFALYNEPDGGYHGLRFARDLGDLNALAFIMRLRAVGLRNLGPTLSPDAAWIFLQGVESLPLRIERHSSNALKVAEFLRSHPKVAWVRYPGLDGDPSNALAKKYLKNGFGGMVVFGAKGGYGAAVKIVDGIKLFSNLANVGDAKSLILHPASTSHSQLGEEAQRAAGLAPDLIRLTGHVLMYAPTGGFPQILALHPKALRQIGNPWFSEPILEE